MQRCFAALSMTVLVLSYAYDLRQTDAEMLRCAQHDSAGILR